MCFVDFMKKQGLKASDADPCLFARQHEGAKLIVVIYVDDGLVAGTDEVKVEEFMHKLRQSFKITTGSLSQFLGMNITRLTDGSVFVNQTTYAKKVLSKFNMDTCNPVSTPSEKSYMCSGKDDPVIGHEVPYRQAVGSLMYLATVTKPDLAYAVSAVSESLENPKSSDWCAVKRILKYIKGTLEFGLLYQANEQSKELKAYSDADFAGDTKKRRSRSGVVSMFSGAAISWLSQKQRSIVLSTTEAEYIAASEAAKEAIWLKQLFKDLIDIKDCPLFFDNASAVKLARNPEFNYKVN